MSADASIELLERVARASDAQKAAIERFLAGEPLPDLRALAEKHSKCCCADLKAVLKEQVEELKAEMRKVLAEAIKPIAAAKRPIDQGEAERLFAVLQRLRSKRAGMMAPLYDVFIATVLERRSQKAAAKSCNCSPALLSKRVGELEKEFGLSLEQLQNYAQPLLEMETSVKGQRYARKRRGAPEDEAGQYAEEDSQAAKEDETGYLPEERHDPSS